jgi:hypothetical protein
MAPSRLSLLVILSGVLLLVARLPSVPLPKWVHQESEKRG